MALDSHIGTSTSMGVLVSLSGEEAWVGESVYQKVSKPLSIAMSPPHLSARGGSW